MEEGATTAVIDRNDRGYEYMAQAKEKNHESLFVKTDLTDPNQISAALDKVIETYGRIDAVINNVGVNDVVGLDRSYEDFIQSIKLNLASYFMTVKCALPKLIESKGNILNVGSKVAFTGQGGTSGYAASKGGVAALTREWAVDLAKHGIRSNSLIIAECLTPAYEMWAASIENGEERLKQTSSIIPFEKRMTMVKEVVDTAMFLVSDRSSHTTGQQVFVDGGYVHLDRAMALG